MSDWDRNASRWGQNPAATRGAVVDQGLRAFMLGVYNNMVIGMVITGVVAFAVYSAAVTSDASAGIEAFRAGLYITPFGQAIYSSPLSWVIWGAPIIFVLVFSFSVARQSASIARIMFFVFSALVGLSISSIFIRYSGGSIANAFFVTAATFGALSLYGYTTKRDLGPMGSFLLMGACGIFLVWCANVIFIHSAGMTFWMSILIVIVFSGLTAYDTQKLRETYYQVGGNGELAAKVSVIGALELYIDFINIFLAILRLTGSSRN